MADQRAYVAMKAYDELPEFAKEYAKKVATDARWIRDYVQLQRMFRVPDSLIEAEFNRRAKRPEQEWIINAVKSRRPLRVSVADRFKSGMMGDMEKAIRGLI